MVAILLNAANLHVIFSVTNCDYFEYWMPQAAHQFGLVEDIGLNGRGVIEAPTLPGIGFLRLVRGTARKLGITGLKKLCSLAEGFGLNCEIGTAGNSLLNAANLHGIFSVTNCDYFEYWMPQASEHSFLRPRN